MHERGPGPEMLEQARLRPTMNTAESYGEEHPEEFGGVYWESRPAMHVVFLATGHVEVHERALRGLVAHPDRITVHQCRHSQQQNEAWLNTIHQRLHKRSRGFDLTGTQLTLVPEGFGITVCIWPWSDEAAESVRRELDRIPLVAIKAMPPAAPL